MTLKFDEWPRKTIKHLVYTTSNFVHHFKSIGEFKLELQSGNAQFGWKMPIFLSRVTRELEIWWMTLKIKRTPLLYCIKFVQHFKAIGIFKLELQSGNAQFGSKLDFFVPGDFESWRMTLKNNRAPLLYYVKLCLSFQIHLWNQTWVTAWKRSSRVKIGDFFLSRMTLKLMYNL